MDWPGVVLIVSGVALLSWGIDSISSRGLFASASLLAMVGGLAILAAFGWQERRHPWPLIGRELAQRRQYLIVMFAGTYANVAYCLMVIVVTIELQQVRGYSAAVAGLVFAVPAMGTSLCGPISGRLAGRYPAGQVIAVSIAVGAVGLLLQAAGGWLVVNLIGLSLSGVAFGMGFNFTNIATQSVLPVQLSAESSGLTLTTMITLGGFGVVLGAIGLELFDSSGHAGSAVTHVLVWAAVTSLVVGGSFGWSQRHGTRM